MYAAFEPKTDVPVVLTMMRSEAEVLRTICSRIGGDPSGNRRVTDELTRVLRNLGISVNEECYVHGNIYLK